MFSQTKTIPFQELPTGTGLPSGSGIFFGATINSSSITITFQGPSDRWIAFGIGTSMAPTDVFIYSNGKLGATHVLGWNDYYNTAGSAIGVNNDAIQNWNVISTGSFAPLQRTVTATRALNTGDANDVTLSFLASSLDLVWAIGATADYTIAYHGVANRSAGIVLPWLTPPTASFSVLSTTACAGSNITYLNTSTGGQNTYTWSFAGGTPATSTATAPVINYTVPGTYSVSLVTSNAIGSNTLIQSNYITITPTVAPGLSITQAGGGNPLCAGALATFTAAPTNGGASPFYQWQVNGQNVGTNSSTYATTALPASAVVTCVMTSNAICASPVSVTSTAISMTVNSTAAASVSVALASGNNPICVGAIAVFTANPGNGGSSPSYQWLVNGFNNGSNSPTFTTNTLSNGDVVSCVLSSNSSCASSTLAASAGITMTVSSLLTPSVAIAVTTGSNPLCAGTAISATATPVFGGNAPAYQWQVNGVNAGSNSSSFSPSNLANGDLLSCILLSNLSCASPNTATSSAIAFTVNPVPPAPTITSSGSTTFCAGSSVILNSSAVMGNLWSTGAITTSIAVTATGNFTVTQTLNGCTSLSSATVAVQVHSLPLVQMQAIGALCTSESSVALNQGLPTGGIYSGTGVSNAGFSPGQSGVGTFVITYSYTDSNGCANTASTTALVSECLGVKMQQSEHPDVFVFPNPSSGLITVYSGKGKITGLRLTDLDGKIILKRHVNNEQSLLLDLSQEAAGIYNLEVILESGIVHVRLNKKDQ